jgi:Tfp pilus assembly protein PilP
MGVIKIIKPIRLFITLLIIFPLLSACERGVPTAKKTTVAKRGEKIVQTQGLQTKPVSAKETIEEEEESYVYNPRGRRDPFIPLVEVGRKEEIAKKPKGTLESYDATDFRLKAIAERGGEWYALLIAPDNRAFTVKEGTVIGLRNGKVEKITSDKIIIIEYIKDYKGELKPREIVLELRKGEVGE